LLAAFGIPAGGVIVHEWVVSRELRRFARNTEMWMGVLRAE
jgi:hypothetical protein